MRANPTPFDMPGKKVHIWTQIQQTHVLEDAAILLYLCNLCQMNLAIL